MDLASARALAEQLLRQHGLTGWRIVIDRAKTRAGVCRFGSQEIGLSGPLTMLHSPTEVRDTILHEIAHALVGPEHKHDAVWRARAAQLGCSTRACLPRDAPRVAAPWIGTCPAGHTVQRHRRPERQSSCPRCCRTYAPEHLFRWQFQGRDVPLPPDAARGASGRVEAPPAAHGPRRQGIMAAGARTHTEEQIHTWSSQSSTSTGAPLGPGAVSRRVLATTWLP